MSKNFYGLMVKYPEPGMVKTRLAADIGMEQAALIYRQLITRVMNQTMPIGAGYERYMFYDPPNRKQDFVSWFPDEIFMAQSGGDVGRRMDNVIRRLLKKGADKAVITGSDIPDISSEIILRAFEMLDRVDVVLGPARDGGYYLIGMKRPIPEVFRNITWSSKDVFMETVKVIKLSGISYGALPALSDLDTIEDLKIFSVGAAGSTPETEEKSESFFDLI
jgi:uncharacterized protein